MNKILLIMDINKYETGKSTHLYYQKYITIEPGIYQNECILWQMLSLTFDVFIREPGFIILLLGTFTLYCFKIYWMAGEFQVRGVV